MKNIFTICVLCLTFFLGTMISYAAPPAGVAPPVNAPPTEAPATPVPTPSNSLSGATWDVENEDGTITEITNAIPSPEQVHNSTNKNKIDKWIEDNGGSVKAAVEETLIEEGNFAQKYAAEGLISVIESDCLSSLYKTFDKIKSAHILGTSSEDSLLKTLYNAIKIVGYCLLGLCFVIELIDISSDFNMTKEQFFKVFIKYTLAKTIIDGGLTIGIKFYNAGINLAIGLGISSNNATSNVYDLFKEEFYDIYKSNVFANIFTGFRYQIDSLLPSFCNVVVHVILFSVIIEMAVRILLLPIAAVDVVHSGFHGHGFHYLKSLLAVALQFAAMMLCLYVASMVKVSLLNAKEMDNVLYFTIINLITISTMVKAAGFTRELF